MKKTACLGAALAAWAMCLAPVRGQEPVLVRDISTGLAYSPGSYASSPVFYRGETYFWADDGFLGAELWATDGTLPGTRLVADLCPGRCPGAPWRLTPAGGLLFFVAGNSTAGYEPYWLWRSDGTSRGTFPLVDLEIGTAAPAGPVAYLAPFRNGVVFIVHDRARRAWDLWGSDGTTAGTRKIAPLPGRFDPESSPADFNAPSAHDDGLHHHFTWQNRLWVTDGTAAGTHAVSAFGQPCGGSARIGRWVVYAAEDASFDCEPWVTDGTARGTRQLRDIWPGEQTSYPGTFVAAGNLVYFTAFGPEGHRQLWKTNGTSRGTTIVRPLAARGLGKVEIVGAAGSRLYFLADDGTHGIELWRTDGSPATTALVADLTPGRSGTFLGAGRSLGDRLVFTATLLGEGSPSLFVTRGTADTTRRLLRLGDAGEVQAAAGGRVYFTGTVTGTDQELGVTDGTVAGTRVLDLARPAASSSPHRLIAGRGGLVFLATGGEFGSDLWRSGGHPEDTERLGDLLPGANYGEGMWLAPGSGGAFYYTFAEKRFGWTDGQTVRDLLPPEAVSFPEGFVDLADRTVFLATRPVSDSDWQPWIWASDGTPEGTTALAAADAATGGFSSFWSYAALEPASGTVRCLVQKRPDFPERLSKLTATDGTAPGTRALVSIPVPRSMALDGFAAAGRFVFSSFSNALRSTLWASDGTAAGTREVYTIQRPGDLSLITGLTGAGEQAFFLGDDLEHGHELWTSDGTPEGTHRVADLAPGAASSAPAGLAAFGGRLLFSADDGTHGRELWVSDGTEEGTRLLEIRPGRPGSFPQAFREVGGAVVFAADDGIHGLEPWVTDGTPEGTRLLADVMAGPLPSSPRDFAVYNEELYFDAGRPQEGYELWKLPLAALAPSTGEDR